MIESTDGGVWMLSAPHCRVLVQWTRSLGSWHLHLPNGDATNSISLRGLLYWFNGLILSSTGIVVGIYYCYVRLLKVNEAVDKFYRLHLNKSPALKFHLIFCDLIIIIIICYFKYLFKYVILRELPLLLVFILIL